MGGFFIPFLVFFWIGFCWMALMICGVHPHKAKDLCLPIASFSIVIGLLTWVVVAKLRDRAKKAPPAS
jgi:hypothetical protein